MTISHNKKLKITKRLKVRVVKVTTNPAISCVPNSERLREKLNIRWL